MINLVELYIVPNLFIDLDISEPRRRLFELKDLTGLSC
jgi:hypothetical protein